MSYEDKQVIQMGEYPSIYMPDHHRASKTSGCVYIHILVAEKKLGRNLTPDECVHHVNGNKNDYSKDNLWIFKTIADHTAYHCALQYGLNYALICTDGVMECVTYSHNLYPETYVFPDIYVQQHANTKKVVVKNVCPICGNHKSLKAKYCASCYKNIRKANIPPEEELKKLLKTKNYSQIGRIYNVSANAVKKWAKSYGLYQSKKRFEIAQSELAGLMVNHSLRQIAGMYDTSLDVVRAWVKYYGLTVPNKFGVKCVETGEEFENMTAAAMAKYPMLSANGCRQRISASCTKGSTYKGLHWIRI